MKPETFGKRACCTRATGLSSQLCSALSVTKKGANPKATVTRTAGQAVVGLGLQVCLIAMSHGVCH